METENIPLKEYQDFISNTLKPKLEAALASRSEITDEIVEYEKTLGFLQAYINNENNIGEDYLCDFVELDSSRIYLHARAKQQKLESIYIHCGTGVFIEKDLKSALKISQERISLLTKKAETANDEITTLVNDIEESLYNIEELRKTQLQSKLKK